MSCTAICLDRPSPDGSSGQPEARRAAVSLLFGLASNGACMCPLRYRRGGSLLHCLSTLTGFPAVYFCCAILGVAPTGRYPASCPVKPGLSSSESLQPRPYVQPASHLTKIAPGSQPFVLSVQPPPPVCGRMSFSCGLGPAGCTQTIARLRRHFRTMRWASQNCLKRALSAA